MPENDLNLTVRTRLEGDALKQTAQQLVAVKEGAQGTTSTLDLLAEGHHKAGAAAEGHAGGMGMMRLASRGANDASFALADFMSGNFVVAMHRAKFAAEDLGIAFKTAFAPTAMIVGLTLGAELLGHLVTSLGETTEAEKEGAKASEEHGKKLSWQAEQAEKAKELAHQYKQAQEDVTESIKRATQRVAELVAIEQALREARAAANAAENKAAANLGELTPEEAERRTAQEKINNERAKLDEEDAAAKRKADAARGIFGGLNERGGETSAAQAAAEAELKAKREAAHGLTNDPIFNKEQIAAAQESARQNLLAAAASPAETAEDAKMRDEWVASAKKQIEALKELAEAQHNFDKAEQANTAVQIEKQPARKAMREAELEETKTLAVNAEKRRGLNAEEVDAATKFQDATVERQKKVEADRRARDREKLNLAKGLLSPEDTISRDRIDTRLEELEMWDANDLKDPQQAELKKAEIRRKQAERRFGLRPAGDQAAALAEDAVGGKQGKDNAEQDVIDKVHAATAAAKGTNDAGHMQAVAAAMEEFLKHAEMTTQEQQRAKIRTQQIEDQIKRLTDQMKHGAQ